MDTMMDHTAMDFTMDGPDRGAADVAPANPTASEPSLFGRLVERDTAAPAAPQRLDGVTIGRLAAIGEGGECIVSIPILNVDRRAALSTVALNATDIGRPLALGFEAGDARRPIILGLMLEPEAVMPSTRPSPEAPAVFSEGVDVHIEDGRLVITAAREIELRSGEAALLMTADGRVLSRGVDITHQASAALRLLGGSVNVN